MICDGHLHYWLRLKVDTTWPWMWHPQLYRTHQYTEQLELSLFVVLYADRIGVVGGYWIPESLVCHGHPPHGATPPPHTWPPHHRVHQYTEELELSLFVGLFSAKIWRFLQTYCVGTMCSGLVLLNKCMTRCLIELPVNLPPPTPLSLFCLCHGPKWCIKIFYFVHENPRWTRIMVYFLFHDKLSL